MMKSERYGTTVMEQHYKIWLYLYNSLQVSIQSFEPFNSSVRTAQIMRKWEPPPFLHREELRFWCCHISHVEIIHCADNRSAFKSRNLASASTNWLSITLTSHFRPMKISLRWQCRLVFSISNSQLRSSSNSFDPHSMGSQIARSSTWACPRLREKHFSDVSIGDITHKVIFCKWSIQSNCDNELRSNNFETNREN